MLLVAVAGAGCAVGCVATVQDAAALEPPPEAGHVRLSSVAVPEGAIELGRVEVTEEDGLEAAMEAFRVRVAELNGDFGKIERSATVFGKKLGGPRAFCRGWVCTIESRTIEVPKVHLTGRAYRLAGKSPEPKAGSREP
jgi:hypothetical protein